MVLTCTYNLFLSKNKKNIENYLLKIFILSLLHVSQHSIKILQKNVHMMFLEDESRSELDTAGSTCPGMDATLAELVYHFVPGSRVRQIYRTEGAQPTGIAEVAWVLYLKKKL